MYLSLYESAIISGIAVGGIYALIAVGLTQIFKVTRILNFAQGGYVLWGAYFYGRLTTVYNWHVGYAALVSILLIGVMGYLSELVILRYAAKATPVNKLIITFGLLQFLTALAVIFFTTKETAAQPLFPSGGITLLNTPVAWEQLANIGCAFAVVVAYGAFLRFTRLGLLTRATAEDPLMATLMGARRQRIDAFNWTFASMIAGLAGILIASLQPFYTTTFLSYLLISLIATLVGGLESLTWAAIGGLLVGVVYSVAGVASSTIGAPNIALFVAVAVLVLVRRRWPGEVEQIAWTRNLSLRSNYRGWLNQRLIILICWVALLVAVPLYDVWGTTGSLILFYTVLCFSMIPVIGWTGQVTLAAGGLAGIGAYTMEVLNASYSIPFPIAVLGGVFAGILAGALIGALVAQLPLVLTAVVTLAFTDAVSNWLLYSGAFKTLSGEFTINSPNYLDTTLKIFFVFLAVTTVVLIGLWNLRRSDWGTRMLAARQAPTMLRHFGVSPARMRIYAFAASGAIAGIAGIMYALVINTVVPSDFSSSLSLEALLFAATGGVAVLYGPVIGSIGFLGANQLFGLARFGATNIPDLVSGATVVQMMSMSSDGYASWLTPPDRIDLNVRSGKVVRAIASSRFRSVLGASALSTIDLQQADELQNRHGIAPTFSKRRAGNVNNERKGLSDEQ